MLLNDSSTGRKRLRLPNRRPSDTFKEVCRDADRRKAHGPADDYIPHNWSDLSIEPLIAHFDGARRRSGAPHATVEALMFSLRERGTRALEERDAKRRLSELSDDQVIEVGNRLQRLRPEIARAWTAAEVKILFQARVKK
jgi:hypothetical protein